MRTHFLRFQEAIVEQPQMRDYFAQLGKVIVQCSMFMYEIPFSTFSSCNIRGLAIWRGAPLWKPPQTRTQANGASQGREVFWLVHLPFFKYICFFYFKSSTRTFFAYKSPAAYISSRSAAYKTHFAVFIIKHFQLLGSDEEFHHNYAVSCQSVPCSSDFHFP